LFLGKRLPAWGETRTLMLLALAVTTGSAPLAWTYMTGNYSWAVAVSSDGRYVIAGSDDMHAYFFDTRSTEGKPLWSYATNGYVRHVAISGNGTWAAASDLGGNIFLFRLDAPGKPVWSFRSDSPIDALAMNEEGDCLVVGDRSGNVYVFGTGSARREYAIPGGLLAVSLSRMMTLAATSTHGGLYFFGEVSLHATYVWSFQQDTSFPQIAMAEDSSYIVAGGSDGYMYLIDSSGQLLDRQRVGAAISAISISGIARRVIAGSPDGIVSLYAVGARLERMGSLEIRKPVTSVALSSSGDRVSYASLDGTIAMFDQSLTTNVWTFRGGAIVHALSISGNGRVMAAVDDTGSIYLFDEESPLRKSKTMIDAVVGLTLTVVCVGSIIAYLVFRQRRNNGGRA